MLEEKAASRLTRPKAIEVPAAKKILGSFMSFLWPSLTLGNELDADKISHDPDVVKAYENDPLRSFHDIEFNRCR